MDEKNGCVGCLSVVVVFFTLVYLVVGLCNFIVEIFGASRALIYVGTIASLPTLIIISNHIVYGMTDSSSEDSSSED